MKCVVIGGGIAGAAITRVLARKGVDVTLLERTGQLCSGATWHAAGLVTRFAGSPKLKKIHVRSLDLLEELHDKHDINLKLPGSIRLIEKGNLDRLFEARQHLAMARLYDRPEFVTEMISADQIAERHPLINVSGIECGLWTPHDGWVDPTMLTHAVSFEAKAAGAAVRLNSNATAVTRDTAGRFAVKTAQGEVLNADVVVNAAGLWARNVTSMMDTEIPHPAFVIEHQYVVTESVSALADRPGLLPVLRDLAGSSYIRQEQKGLLVGPYESECRLKSQWVLGPPDEWGAELFEEDLDRITPNLAAASELVPSFGTVGIRSVVNGPTIWQGDSLPRVGRTAIAGWYDFNSLTYGIAQSLALAEYLGELMLTGEQPFDGTDYFDPLRYSFKHSEIFAHDKIVETYTHNNCITYPHEYRSGGLKHITQSKSIEELARQGGQLGAVGPGAVAVPLVYISNADSRVNMVRDCKTFSHFEWADRVQAEAEAVLSSIGLGYSSFSKLFVTGSDALKLVKTVTTAAVPTKQMACRLTYALTQKGLVHSEYTVCRHSDECFYFVGSRDHAAVDAEWFRAQARLLGLSDVEVVDRSDAIEVFHIAGPESKAALSAIDDRVADVPFFNSSMIQNFAGLPLSVNVCHMSFTGCDGYELHVDTKNAVVLLNALLSNSRLTLFGGLAQNSLRIEKGYMIRADFDYAHYSECNIDSFMSKTRDYIGKDTASSRNMRTLLANVEAEPGWEWSIISDSPIIHTSTDQVVGYTTTAAKGGRTSRTIAHGFVDRSITVEDCHVEAYGNNWDIEEFLPLQ